jgi:RNA polymerase sporulation-specific sigma factor
MVSAHRNPDISQLNLGDLIAVASAQPILDERDAGALIERAHRGDRSAREQLVMGNLRVAIDEAIRTRGLGTPQRTLVPMGVRTLLEAIDTYDPIVDGPFSEYVRSRVRLTIRAGIGVS